jgi:hypothetical protein
MSAYIKLSTGEYPRHEGDIRLEYPDISDYQTGDTFPCPPTYAPVALVPPPKFDQLCQCVYEGPPQQAGSGWIMTWVVRALSPEEIEARQKAQVPFDFLSGYSGAVPDVIA